MPLARALFNNYVVMIQRMSFFTLSTYQLLSCLFSSLHSLSIHKAHDMLEVSVKMNIIQTLNLAGH